MRHSHRANYCGGTIAEPGKCRFHFPKPCNQASYLDDAGNFHPWRGPDDADIVEYNPHLLCQTRAHINCKLVIGTKAIPYVCSYLGKGDTYAKTAIIEARRAEKEAAAAQGREKAPVDIAHVYENRCVRT